MQKRIAVVSVVVLTLMVGSLGGAAFATGEFDLCEAFPQNCETTTVTSTVTSATTVTVTQAVANVAPFFDVYAGHSVFKCWTFAQMSDPTFVSQNPGGVSGIPDKNCHGVPNTP